MTVKVYIQNAGAYQQSSLGVCEAPLEPQDHLGCLKTTSVTLSARTNEKVRGLYVVYHFMSVFFHVL